MRRLIVSRLPVLVIPAEAALANDLCPNCGYTLRFSRTIFADKTEIWRCDHCGQETVADVDAAFAERYGAGDTEAVDDTLVLDQGWRDQFAAKVDAARKRGEDKSE